MSNRSGIVAAVDGSPESMAAVDWAARSAAMRRSPLKLVHVMIPPVVIGFPEAAIPADYFEWQQEEGRKLLAEARNAVEKTLGDVPIEVSSEIISGSAVATLVDVSKTAQLIVVGCRGRGALERGLLGSVSSSLVHHAHCPVAVIHDEDSATRSSTAPVVVGIDGSPASELATSIAFEEASFRGVELVAVHAWHDEKLVEVPTVDWSAVRGAGEEILSERLAGWTERYPDVPVRRVLVADKVARLLLEQSESAQLLVVGSRGRGGFVGMLLGSVATAVVNTARLPVIVAREL